MTTTIKQLLCFTLTRTDPIITYRFRVDGDNVIISRIELMTRGVQQKHYNLLIREARQLWKALCKKGYKRVEQ